MAKLVSIAVGMAAMLIAAGTVAEPRNPSVAALPPAAQASNTHAAAPAEADGLSRAEALARLQGEGFKVITRLERDSEGNWIGAARRGNRVVDVAVDTDGDVIAW